jgi:uncharacterized membrane protein
MILFSLACAPPQDVNIEINGNTQTEPENDTNSSSLNLSDADCENAPMVTWDNWAQSMLITHCQGCHASTSTNRYGAPESIHFDYETTAIDLGERIYIRVIEDEDMPPAGGLLEEDIYLLDTWLRCSVGL